MMSEAQAHFRRAARALNELIDELEAQNPENASDAVRIVRDLKNALGPALSERERLETELRKDAGIVNGYAIDFDAARFEIGRRLACLRAAGSEGGVSE
ncbi:MAG: hypothetical protein AAGH83_00260 [Pseudomonadota bacterium]